MADDTRLFGEIEGIGVPSLELKGSKEREPVDGSETRGNAESIRVGNITFRLDKSLLNEVNLHCRLERTPGKFRVRIALFF